MGTHFPSGQCLSSPATSDLYFAPGSGSVSLESKSPEGSSNIDVLLHRRNCALSVLCHVLRDLASGGGFHNWLLLSDQHHSVGRWNFAADWDSGHVHHFWIRDVQAPATGQHHPEQHSGGWDICAAGHEAGLPKDPTVQLPHIPGHAALQRHLLVCQLWAAGERHHLPLLRDLHYLRLATHQYQPDGLQISMHHGPGPESV